MGARDWAVDLLYSARCGDVAGQFQRVEPERLHVAESDALLLEQQGRRRQDDHDRVRLRLRVSRQHASPGHHAAHRQVLSVSSRTTHRLRRLHVGPGWSSAPCSWGLGLAIRFRCGAT